MASVALTVKASAAGARSGNVDALIDEPRLSGLQLRIFAICAFVLLCEGYDLQALALAVPEIASEFGIAAERLSVALSASLAGMAIGGAFFAPFGDRHGRKPMLIIAMLLTGGSTIATLAFAHGWWIAACRLFTGIGLGITTVNAAAMISDYSPAKWRFLLMTLLTSTVPGGAFFAAMIAPALIAADGWRAIFILGAAVPFAGAAVTWLWAPESLKWLVATRPDDSRIGAILRRQAPDLDPARLFITRRDETSERGSIWGLLSSEHRIRTLVVWLSAISGAFSLYLMVSWLPTLLRQAHWSTADALTGTAAPQLGGIAGSLLMAWAIDRRKLLAALVTGYGCATAALLGIGLLPESVLGWKFMLLLAGAGTSGMQSIWMAVAVGLYPLDLRATSAGWLAAVSRIGAVMAPLAGGIALSAHITPQHVLLALVGPIGVSTIAIVLARRHFVPPPPIIESGETT
jgi:AAHS family 4-hydroxybenzoate transporter-like MFS transporter